MSAVSGGGRNGRPQSSLFTLLSAGRGAHQGIQRQHLPENISLQKGLLSRQLESFKTATPWGEPEEGGSEIVPALLRHAPSATGAAAATKRR